MVVSDRAKKKLSETNKIGSEMTSARSNNHANIELCNSNYEKH